ncbi:MAG TPA: adenylate/guanylate cyclase domain-containing protein [Actinomycetota bacterium]|nr:adenylate/guanylate cyclase domain-containing protein [Actinomycetota bacterium]
MKTCPSCSEENADRARFCSNCGTSLETSATAGAEERKTVSVLFVDLVGFTARSDDADPEDVRSTLRIYHERLREEIERFGGTVEKFIGDAVMAVFGAPVAHEDDAERAVRAALRITEAIGEVNAERPGLDLAVRGAVNTGEAVVVLGARPERGEGFVTGDVVNVASRLQGLAPVGGVVVGELTHRATDGPIEYEELEPVEVKGKEGRIRLWRVVGARSRFGVDIEAGTSTPLVGREHELGLLQQLYRRAAGDRAVQLVTVSGEPGVGKSRLVREFRSFIDDEPELIVWRQGRCLPYGEGITYWALGEVVKAHAGILENDDAEETAGKLATAVAIVVEEDAERDWITARLRPLVGLAADDEAAADREESFAAWRGFLEAIAATGPFVLVIEDLHWADPALLAFVEHLADWASGVPLLILCTARPELYERHPAWGGGSRNHTAIALSPLSPEETAKLIGALLERAVLPSETQSALMSRAGGNPLYAEEFVRMLIDRGVLVRHGAAWELTSGEDEIPVPESVHALIAARLDTLPPARKALLQDASVLGKVFWAGAVAEMGGLDPSPVREGLHELGRKELVRPARRPTIEGETEYAFWHVLIRDVAYGQIPRAIRAEKHLAAAAWIERIAGERVEDSVELLVHHHEQAIQLARSGGADVAELQARLVPLLIQASERALRLDTTQATAFFRRALALTRSGETDRLRVLLVGTRLTTFGGSTDPEHEAIARDALEEARALGDRLAEGEILSAMSRLAWAAGDTARQFELVQRAISILEELPPGREYARALTRAASAYGLAGLTHETLRGVERALPIVREFGAETDRAVLLQFGGEARVYLGEVEEGIADLREGLRLAREFGAVGMVCASYVNLGDMIWLSEGPAQGQELYERGIEFGERRGAGLGTRWGRMQTMWTRFDLGRWDELLEIGAELIATEPDPGTQIAVLAETYRQHVLVRRGVSDGASFESDVLPRALEIGDDQVVVPALHVAGLGRLARDDERGAVATIEELHVRMTERPGSRGWLLDEATDVCRAAGAVDTLRSLLEGYTPHLLRDRISVTTAEAALAELHGELERAARGYDEAAEGWAGFPHPLQHGLAATAAGRCLLGLGRASEARDRLRTARGSLRDLGATPLVGEVDGLLERATARSG